jgi:hypothetical protein
MKHAIAVNRMATGKLPQGDPRFALFNDSFENKELEPIDLANEIYTGHAYTSWHSGRRKVDNFILAQHIAVDMDTQDERSSFDALMSHDLVRSYASLLHTTPSHKADAPRARVIFLLDEPITEAKSYQAASKFLISQFEGADSACSDASRFFYGSLNCEIRLLEGVLPVEHLRSLYRHAAPPTPPISSPEPRQPERRGAPMPRRELLDILAEPILHAREGTRNTALTRQAFLAGKDIRSGRVDEQQAVAYLLGAALSVGLDEKEALPCISRSIQAGMAIGH